MDPSAPAAQDVPTQTPAVQTGVPVSQPTPVAAPAVQKPQPKMQISVSGGGGLESGSAVIVAENPDDEDDEDELQVAPHEKKNLGVMGQGDSEEQSDEQQIVSQTSVADVQEEAVELAPSVPEVVTSSPEVEKLVEITPPDRPKLTPEIKRIGVTHSGLGVIDLSDTHFAPAKIPVSFEEAIVEEEQIKANRLHNSKFWLLEKIKYLWRKVNPNIGLTVKKKPAKIIAPVNALSAKPSPVIVNKVPVIKNTPSK